MPILGSTNSCTLNLYQLQPGAMPHFKHDPTDQTTERKGSEARGWLEPPGNLDGSLEASQ